MVLLVLVQPSWNVETKYSGTNIKIMSFLNLNSTFQMWVDITAWSWATLEMNAFLTTFYLLSFGNISYEKWCIVERIYVSNIIGKIVDDFGIIGRPSRWTGRQRKVNYVHSQSWKPHLTASQSTWSFKQGQTTQIKNFIVPITHFTSNHIFLAESTYMVLEELQESKIQIKEHVCISEFQKRMIRSIKTLRFFSPMQKSVVLDRPARLIRLLFRFASDFVLVKLNKNINW